jgi:hypothetical protein
MHIQLRGTYFTRIIQGLCTCIIPHIIQFLLPESARLRRHYFAEFGILALDGVSQLHHISHRGAFFDECFGLLQDTIFVDVPQAYSHHLKGMKEGKKEEREEGRRKKEGRTEGREERSEQKTNERENGRNNGGVKEKR